MEGQVDVIREFFPAHIWHMRGLNQNGLRPQDLEDTFSSCPSFSWPDEGRGALRNLSKSINDDWWPKAGTDPWRATRG